MLKSLVHPPERKAGLASSAPMVVVGGVGMRVGWRGGGGGECLHVAADVYPEFIMAMFSDVCMSPSVYPVCLVMHGGVDMYPVYPVSV